MNIDRIKMNIKFATDFECTKCKKKIFLKDVIQLRPYQIVACHDCDKYFIILDSCLARPADINTRGMTKHISFPRWVIERFVDAGYVIDGELIHPGIQGKLIEKFNTDHPENKILR